MTSAVRRLSTEQSWFGKCTSPYVTNTSGVISPNFCLQLPELLTTTQLNHSISSSGCPSDDSGIERTLNLSPSSHFPEDTDSDDAQSFGGFDTNRSNELRLEPRTFQNEIYRNYSSGHGANEHPSISTPPYSTRTYRGDEYQAKVPIQKNRDNRFQILAYDQVIRLHEALCKAIPVHSRYPGFPTIWLTLSDLFHAVRTNMKAAGIPIRDIRLNGGAASYVIGKDSYPSYNDIDILISVDLSSNSSIIQKVKSAVLDALISFIPENKSAESKESNRNPSSANVSSQFTHLENSNSGSICNPNNQSGQKTGRVSRDFDLPLPKQSNSCGGGVVDMTQCTNNSSESPINGTSFPVDDKLSSPSSIQSHLGDSPFISLEDLVCPQLNPAMTKPSYHSNLAFPNSNGNSQLCQRLSANPNSLSPNDNLNLRESYVYKQFRKYSPDEDCWSLLSLGMPNQDAKVIELKFVDRMKRQFEFSVDSFQIVLDPLLMFYEKNGIDAITPHFYPTVVAESVFGSFYEAFWHLENKLISTKEPERIRGGGLLKYCRLLVGGYTPAREMDVRSLERYMCSRFFIDFQDLNSQQAKLQSFLSNHFTEDEINLKIEYLRTLYRVVNGSTICLMSHEHFLILNLISHFLQHFMYRAQLKRDTLNLDWFIEKQNLVIDRIFLGNQLFPTINRPNVYPINYCCNCSCSDKMHSSREHYLSPQPDLKESTPNYLQNTLTVNWPRRESDNGTQCTKATNRLNSSDSGYQEYSSSPSHTAVT